MAAKLHKLATTTYDACILCIITVLQESKYMKKITPHEWDRKIDRLAPSYMLLQPNIVEILEPELDQFLLKNCLIIIIIIITDASMSSQNLQTVRESIKLWGIKRSHGNLSLLLMTMAYGSGSSAAAAACAVKLAFFLSSSCKAIHLWGANCKWEGNLRRRMRSSKEEEGLQSALF